MTEFPVARDAVCRRIGKPLISKTPANQNAKSDAPRGATSSVCTNQNSDEKNLPSMLQKFAPNLTPSEASQLSADIIEELGLTDISTAQTLQQCRKPSDLTPQQKQNIFDFLNRLPERDQGPINKLNNILNSPP